MSQDPHTCMDDKSSDFALVSCAVQNLDPICSSKIIAIASVEITVGGVAFLVNGIEIFIERGLVADSLKGGVGVRLPRYRAPDGQWRSAINLPEEMKRPIANAVLACCNERGLTRPRFERSLE